MTPRADFVCLSKKCEMGPDEVGAGERPLATVYELPVDATHCPKGHKRLKRLFNQVAVVTRAAAPDPDMRLTSSSHLARSNALLQDGFDHAAKFAPPADMTSRVQSVSSLGFGSRGVGAPMQSLEYQREIARDYHDRRVPQSVRNLPPPLKVMQQMNREPIPTIFHRDPREE